MNINNKIPIFNKAGKAFIKANNKTLKPRAFFTKRNAGAIRTILTIRRIVGEKGILIEKSITFKNAPLRLIFVVN